MWTARLAIDGARVSHSRRQLSDHYGTADRRAEGTGAGSALLLSRSSRCRRWPAVRSEEHTSELQSLMRISYAVFCLKKKRNNIQQTCQSMSSLPIIIN